LVDLLEVASEDTESVVIFSSTDVNLVVELPFVVGILQGNWVDGRG